MNNLPRKIAYDHWFDLIWFHLILVEQIPRCSMAETHHRTSFPNPQARVKPHDQCKSNEKKNEDDYRREYTLTLTNLFAWSFFRAECDERFLIFFWQFPRTLCSDTVLTTWLPLSPWLRVCLSRLLGYSSTSSSYRINYPTYLLYLTTYLPTYISAWLLTSERPIICSSLTPR